MFFELDDRVLCYIAVYLLHAWIEQSTIAVISSIASRSTIKEFFLSVMRKLLQATTEAGSQDGESNGSAEDGPLSRKCIFMDLALSLTQGLDQEAVLLLFTTAKPALQVGYRALGRLDSVCLRLCLCHHLRCASIPVQDSDQRVQKKAYKLLARILKVRNGPAFLAHSS